MAKAFSSNPMNTGQIALREFSARFRADDNRLIFFQRTVRLDSPSSELTRFKATRDAAAEAGIGAVEKRNVRARLTKNLIKLEDPQTNPPEDPSALPKVPIAMSTCLETPQASANPLP